MNKYLFNLAEYFLFRTAPNLVIGNSQTVFNSLIIVVVMPCPLSKCRYWHWLLKMQTATALT